MAEQSYKLIEVVGASDESVQQAVRNALTQAAKTIRNIEWFEVRNVRGAVRNNSEPIFQVTVAIGFRIEA